MSIALNIINTDVKCCEVALVVLTLSHFHGGCKQLLKIFPFLKYLLATGMSSPPCMLMMNCRAPPVVPHCAVWTSCRISLTLLYRSLLGNPGGLSVGAVTGQIDSFIFMNSFPCSPKGHLHVLKTVLFLSWFSIEFHTSLSFSLRTAVFKCIYLSFKSTWYFIYFKAVKIINIRCFSTVGGGWWSKDRGWMTVAGILTY